MDETTSTTQDASEAGEVAARIAERVPLAHFPAGELFRLWSRWPALACQAVRGVPFDEGCDFARLRGQHVFFYAGPSCYFSRTCIGDAAMYLDPAAERAAEGGASPFDSGSLEPPDPRLQPWAGEAKAARWQRLDAVCRPLAGWRAQMRAWLVACYDAPVRYLETLPDRYAAGLPDRTLPAELRAHNGPDGRERHGAGRCGDRRAWTWEVRLRGTVDWRAHLAVLHVAPEEQERADELKDALGLHMRVALLPDDALPGFEALYLYSGPLLREVTGCI